LFTDQLAVSVLPNDLELGEGRTANFTAIASGINEGNFIYQWKKRGSNSLPDKVSGVNETVLSIPDIIKSDEGQYYCIVTNEWNRSVESNNVTLIIYGEHVKISTNVMVK